MPAVRGVHFQPVSYFGRCELEQSEQRITIPDMLAYMEEQTDGMIKKADFLGGGAENSYCSFHGNFMQMPDGTVKAIKSEKHRLLLYIVQAIPGICGQALVGSAAGTDNRKQLLQYTGTTDSRQLLRAVGYHNR